MVCILARRSQKLRNGRMLAITSVFMTDDEVLIAGLLHVGHRDESQTRSARTYANKSQGGVRKDVKSRSLTPSLEDRLSHFVSIPAHSTSSHHKAMFLANPQTRPISEPQPTPAWYNAGPMLAELSLWRRNHPHLRWPVYVMLAVDAMNSDDPAEQQAALSQLVYLSQDGLLEDDLRLDSLQRAKLETLCRAVYRRAVVWQQLHQMAVYGAANHTPDLNTYAMWLQIQQVMDAIPHPQSQAWRVYLRMDELESRLRDEPATRDELASLALVVLERLHSPRLNHQQRELLACAQVQTLDSMLRQCVTRPINVADVVNAVESFERSGTQADAERLARLVRQMRWSTNPLAAELARCLEEQYRSANIRITLTRDLLNRFLNEPVVASEPLERQSGSAQVVGQQQTNTNLKVEMIPATDDWRVKLLADGKVSTDTTVYAQQATFYVEGTGSFQMSKLLTVGRHQVHIAPAEAAGDFGVQLNGYATSYDGVPLLQRVARNTALGEFRRQEAASRSQWQSEVRDQARKTLDSWIDEYLKLVQTQLQSKALNPLTGLGMPLDARRLTTSAEDISGHFLVAGTSHLAAIAPPPAAPAESLMSFQLHRSALNNLLNGLQLQGRRQTVVELYEHLCNRFGIENPPTLDAAAESVVLTFADDQPLRVNFDAGSATLTLRLDKFGLGDHVWRNLNVRCVYDISTASGDERFLQLRKVEVEGESLTRVEQSTLVGLFSGICSYAEELRAPCKYLATYPGGRDLVMTQCLADQGWLALAIGTAR